MSQPPVYNRQADFTSYQTNNPGQPMSGSDLDNEHNAEKLTLDAILTNMAILQRDDTAMANAVVHPDALNTATLALIAADWTPRGLWVTATDYVPGDVVEEAGTSYVAVTAHKAGTFATDHTAGKWVILGFSQSTIQTNAATFAVATGTVDAMVAAFTPTIGALTDGMELKVRTIGLNTITNPTINVDGLGAKVIKRGGNIQLAAGDAYGEIILRYNLSNDVFELLNAGASFTVPTKAAAEALTPVADRKIFVTSDDGGAFIGITGAAAGTYVDDGIDFIGTNILPTGGDGSAAWVRFPEFKKTVTILCTGQSNMVGSSDVISGDASPDSRVIAWNATAGITGTAWVTATLGSAPFSPTGSHHIGYNAAKYIASSQNVNVRLINISLGGQSIDRWIATDGTPTLWDAIVREMAPALADAGVSTIDYVMWHQGEADAGVDTMEHRNKLRTVKSQFEGESWWKAGHTKMIIGGLALGLPQTGTAGAADGQNLALDLFAETDPEVLPVSTTDMHSNATGVHFDDPELIEIGKRYGKSALIQAPYIQRLISTRHVTGNINLTLAPSDANFRDLDDLFEFLSTLRCSPNTRIDTNISAGQYALPIGPRLNVNGQFLRFYGDLAGGFVKPIDTDFSVIGTPNKAADYAMLQARYLTEIVITGNVGLVLGGNSAGYWQDILLSADTPTLQSAAIRASDPSLYTPSGGGIRLVNTAIHGWDGTSNKAIDNDDNANINAEGCIVSHCTAGVSSNNARTSVKSALFAHTGAAVNATNRAFVNAYGSQLHGQTGTQYTSTVGSYVDARTADDLTSKAEATNGIVEV